MQHMPFVPAVLSGFEARFNKDGRMNTLNRVAICKLLGTLVNTTVSMNAQQIEAVYETIEILGYQGDGSSLAVRMDVVKLADFINNCRG